MRADTEARTPLLAGAPEPVDRVVAGERERLYAPAGALGTVVYLHGGGWVTGSPETVDPLCRRLAHAAGARVVSVDYRLAPEHPWPAALDDADAAVRSALARWPDERVAVAGDSAGANLATIVARRLGREAIAGQALVYPVCDAARDTASYRTFSAGYHLDAEDMAWYFAQYAGPATDPDVSPLRASDDQLADAPPAAVHLASHDVLRDEGEAYAARLPAATVRVWPGTVHGFVRWTGVCDVARAAVAAIGSDLRAMLRAEPV